MNNIRRTSRATAVLATLMIGSTLLTASPAAFAGTNVLGFWSDFWYDFTHMFTDRSIEGNVDCGEFCMAPGAPGGVLPPPKK